MKSLFLIGAGVLVVLLVMSFYDAYKSTGQNENAGAGTETNQNAQSTATS